jgi:hypothetical protein
LESVRQYALEKLEESGEAEEIRRLHSDFFLALAERAEPETWGPNQVEWLDRLEQENGNLRAAMGWALSTGDAETAARLGSALWMFWWYHGHQREGRRWMEAVLQSDLSSAYRAKMLMVAGSLAYGHGDYEQSEMYCEECLELSVQIGDKTREAWARVGLDLTAMSRIDHEGGRVSAGSGPAILPQGRRRSRRGLSIHLFGDALADARRRGQSDPDVRGGTSCGQEAR